MSTRNIIKMLIVVIPMSCLLLSCQGTKSNKSDKLIKAYNLDFNWAIDGPRGFASPGLWADADPEEHVKWYHDLGANTIQTFCVSCNGYAWYKNGVVPAQPGLKHDFLTDVVRLGHKKGMKVMGYFCVAANTRWGMENPELSYGYPSTYHIPYTRAYLDYLDTAIRDAIKITGLDGFMVDWIWQPKRLSTEGKWLNCEKELFEELMGSSFPGEDNLSDEDYLEYSRKAIALCWDVIYKATKETDPDCLIWLSCHTPTHPHIINSKMFEELDWLMNEGGELESVYAVREMVGEHTQLMTCLASWNEQDPRILVPAAIESGVGLYGFTKPAPNSLLQPIDQYLSSPVESFEGDNRNIATLARIYNGLSLDYIKK